VSNQLARVATQWNSGATRDSNRGRRVLIPSALTTRPLSHTYTRSDVNFWSAALLGTSFDNKQRYRQSVRQRSN